MIFSFIFIVLIGLPFVFSECPNGCSGNGDCGNRDQCTCFPGYMGNDCSEFICPFGNAHVDTPKGDLDFDRTITTANKVSISTSMYPNGAYEGFPSGAGDQAHFSMECSNNGICDRSIGSCECFPGYEGNACQRQSCPNHCSDRGTCETMSSLADKASGTLYQKLSANGDTTYSLWDADLIQGCRCDPWYSGPDCSQRTCKVGLDPLYKDRNIPIYDAFFLVIGTTSTSTADLTKSTFRLRLFDYYGESYLTKPISLPASYPSTDSECNLCAPVEDAVHALPNKPFPSFDCAAAPEQFTTRSTGGSTVHTITCTFINTPGVLRLPELESVYIKTQTTDDPVVVADVITGITGTVQRGEDYDWASVYLGKTVSIANGGDDITTAGGSAATFATGFTSPAKLATDLFYLLRIRNQYLVYDSTTHKLIWTWPGSTVTNQRIYNAPEGSLLARNTVSTFAFGGTVITATAAPTVARGSWIIYENQIFKVLATDTVAKTITVDRPFFGVQDTGDDGSSGEIYEIIVSATNKYNYAGECSFKGLCDYSTGLCNCFKGYTGDNCDQQNALAN